MIGIFAAIVLLSSCAWSANNYADPTSSYRACSVPFVKAIYDAGPWSVFTIQPIGDRSSVLVWSWHSEDNSKEFLESVISTRLAKGVDVALIRDNWRGLDDSMSAMVDIRKSGFGGIGIVAPFGENATEIKFGPSLNLGKTVVGYAQLQKGAKPYLGLGWYPKGISLDLTVGPNHTWWLRASRPFNHGKSSIIPELRLRGSEGEAHIGFGIGVAY
jgi:hypothetical protein